MTNLLKIVTICLLGFATCADPDDKQLKKLQAVADKCKSRVKASADDLKDLIANNPATTPAGKCLHACVMKELKLVGGNGKFQRKEFLEYTKVNSMNNMKLVDITMKAFDNCNKKQFVITEKKCDDAEEFRNCMREEGKQVLEKLEAEKPAEAKA